MSDSLNQIDQQTCNSLDVAGITFSALCAAHCLLLPLMASMIPTFTQFLDNEWIHLGLLFLLIPIALVSFISRRRVHLNSKPLIFGSLGIILLVAAVLSEGFGPHELETILTVAGSVLLIMAHLINFNSELRAA